MTLVGGWSPTTVLHCPACLSWQIDYTVDASSTYCIVRLVDGRIGVDSRPFRAMLEAELGKHFAECPQWWNGQEP